MGGTLINSIAILLLLTSLILLVGCSSEPAPVVLGTPDIEATVEAKVKAVLTAIPTPTQTPAA